MTRSRQKSCEHAIIDALDLFRNHPDGKDLTCGELLRALWSVWHELGEAFLRRNERIT